MPGVADDLDVDERPWATDGMLDVDERPWATDGMLGVRPTVRATLAANHRASDGLVGARFLSAVDRLLHNPEEL